MEMVVLLDSHDRVLSLRRDTRRWRGIRGGRKKVQVNLAKRHQRSRAQDRGPTGRALRGIRKADWKKKAR